MSQRLDYQNANLRVNFGKDDSEAFVTLVLSFGNSSDMIYMPLTLDHAVKLAQDLTSKLFYRAKRKDVK